jgi:hypothetical protein
LLLGSRRINAEQSFVAFNRACHLTLCSALLRTNYSGLLRLISICRPVSCGIRGTKNFVKDVVDRVAASIEEKQGKPNSFANGLRVAIIYFSDVATMHLSFTSVPFFHLVDRHITIVLSSLCIVVHINLFGDLIRYFMLKPVAKEGFGKCVLFHKRYSFACKRQQFCKVAR